MTEFKFTYDDWTVARNDAPEYSHTMAKLALHVGNVNLMQHEDLWSKKVRESVRVSGYPIAMWLASSWWRLNFEPIPAHSVVRPAVDWRMTHELGAANQGFVWPQIIFATDCEAMQIWAVPSNADEKQSVRYLNGLDKPASVALIDFQRGVEDFIAAILNRLNEVNYQNTDLTNLWQLIQADRADPDSEKYRRLEAAMGYDPDECPEKLMEKALALEKQMGAFALSELAPVYGKSTTQPPLTALEEMTTSDGLTGAPTVPPVSQGTSSNHGLPWQRAVIAAGTLREMIGNAHDTIDNIKLYDLLGIERSEVEKWSPTKRNEAAIAMPLPGNQYKFVPRKKNPIAKRFELARFLGDYLLTGQTNGLWLASTDLSTSRQKYQRAFAAEFLCPIVALQNFLADDYTESAIEDAAQHFQVSPTTVNSLLVNNHLIPSSFIVDYLDARLPYQLGL